MSNDTMAKDVERTDVLPTSENASCPLCRGVLSPRVDKRAAKAFDRCHYPHGKTRQMAAVLSKGNRKELLKSIKTPTLVIHGSHDPLVPLQAGIDIANTIPGARLVTIHGMGHDMPPETWPEIIREISQHTQSIGCMSG